ncbi:hypothetical protein H6G04_21470 [Calothrix membranacea FACHB-236]|nr:hypothetical protein [Calothrix membranacea FACHB-236]
MRQIVGARQCRVLYIIDLSPKLFNLVLESAIALTTIQTSLATKAIAKYYP